MGKIKNLYIRRAILLLLIPVAVFGCWVEENVRIIGEIAHELPEEVKRAWRGG